MEVRPKMSDVKVAFLTDSCSDIPQELTDKYGIDVIGFHIMLDGKEYLERKDMTNNQFYEMMRQSKSVPTTAAITQLEWVDIYAKYVDAGIQDLVHLCINAGGSSTYNNAVKAAELLEDERPGHKMKIHLIDSHTYSMPYGWYLCECARKVRAGEPLDACLREMQDKLARVEICLAAYSLKQMKKSGRVSAAAAVVGDLMGIRPIITLIDGKTRVESKVRGDDKVIPAMIDLCKKRTEGVEDFDYMIGHTSIPQAAELEKACRKAFGKAPLTTFNLGGVVSANTGPDTLALVYVGKPRD